jgi:hypothetical protein
MQGHDGLRRLENGNGTIQHIVPTRLKPLFEGFYLFLNVNGHCWEMVDDDEGTVTGL